MIQVYNIKNKPTMNFDDKFNGLINHLMIVFEKTFPIEISSMFQELTKRFYNKLTTDEFPVEIEYMYSDKMKN
tara:strand:+ start:3283 stop:3501 length:219 start_codon:yes stop_codon:yes gene_type:complete